MKRVILFFVLLMNFSSAHGYGLPRVNLGFSGILDGGPLRQNTGWYYQQLLSYYHAQKLLDHRSQPLAGICDFNLNSWSTSAQVIYQSNLQLLPRARLGGALVLPIILSSTIAPNKLNITTSGAGAGDLIAGLFLQWKPFFHHDRPIFVQRLEFDISLNTGKNRLPCCTINPGSGFVWIDPYWSATLFFTPHFAASWRLHYLWCAKNKKINFKAGSAVHLNFDLEGEVVNNLWLSVSGYFLAQLHNNRLGNRCVPDSKERVLGLGPGMLYSFTDYSHLFAYFYTETLVKNRARGNLVVIRLLHQF